MRAEAQLVDTPYGRLPVETRLQAKFGDCPICWKGMNYVRQKSSKAQSIHDDGRFRLHWDPYWGGYRVSKPEIDDIEVVPAEVYDDLVDVVRALVSDVEAFIEAVGDLL